MELPELQKQIESFIAQVFNRLDTTVDFIDRPSTLEKRWNRPDAPIVQMIFPEDVLTVRPIDARFVATHPITDIFSRDQFVDACVYTIQGIPEGEIAEPILAYVDALVSTYQSIKEIPVVNPKENLETESTTENGGKPSGWQQ